MVLFLSNEIKLDQMIHSLLIGECTLQDEKDLKEALTIIHSKYKSLSSPIQKCVLQTAISNTITILPNLGVEMNNSNNALVSKKEDSTLSTTTSSATSTENDTLSLVPLPTHLSNKTSLFGSNINVLSSIKGNKISIRPYEVYIHAIDEDLLGPLRRDAQISG